VIEIVVRRVRSREKIVSLMASQALVCPVAGVAALLFRATEIPVRIDPVKPGIPRPEIFAS
jgi:hypothetical protein